MRPRSYNPFEDYFLLLCVAPHNSHSKTSLRFISCDSLKELNRLWYKPCKAMITKAELIEILRESPIYSTMDESELSLIVERLHDDYIAGKQNQ